VSRLSLAEIQARVARLAQIIDAPAGTFPTFGYSEQSGRPHIEVDSSGYHFVIAERGNEFKRLTCAGIDDLLYRIFAGITFELSCDIELAHRIEDQDCRRIMFQHQVGLLARLSVRWAEREAQEHRRILDKYPFDDKASLRATLYGDLMKRGLSHEEADDIAYGQYPPPEGETRRWPVRPSPLLPGL
jgi:hypothetical protein